MSLGTANLHAEEELIIQRVSWMHGSHYAVAHDIDQFWHPIFVTSPSRKLAEGVTCRNVSQCFLNCKHSPNQFVLPKPMLYMSTSASQLALIGLNQVEIREHLVLALLFAQNQRGCHCLPSSHRPRLCRQWTSSFMQFSRAHQRLAWWPPGICLHWSGDQSIRSNKARSSLNAWLGLLHSFWEPWITTLSLGRSQESVRLLLLY